MRLRLKIGIPLASLVLIAVIGVIVYNIIPRSVEAAKTTSTATFNFDASKAPGWFAGANIYGDVVNASTSGAKMGTVTKIIGQGTSEQPGGDCFVQYEYWENNSKDPDQVLGEMTAPSDPAKGGTSTLQPTNTVSFTMKMPAGGTPFRLHQYNLTGPDASQMSTGEEFAVLKAGTGYVEIRGYCKTTDQLSVTLPVLSAVSFKL
jgi:hypothetical protein